jgi:hypothetical protein
VRPGRRCISDWDASDGTRSENTDVAKAAEAPDLPLVAADAEEAAFVHLAASINVDIESAEGVEEITQMTDDLPGRARG